MGRDFVTCNILTSKTLLNIKSNAKLYFLEPLNYTVINGYFVLTAIMNGQFVLSNVCDPIFVRILLLQSILLFCNKYWMENGQTSTHLQSTFSLITSKYVVVKTPAQTSALCGHLPLHCISPGVWTSCFQQVQENGSLHQRNTSGVSATEDTSHHHLCGTSKLLMKWTLPY